MEIILRGSLSETRTFSARLRAWLETEVGGAVVDGDIPQDNFAYAGRITIVRTALTTPPVEAMQSDLATLVAFLLGEGPLNGKWFGDTVTGPQFWWRHNLRTAFAALPASRDEGWRIVLEPFVRKVAGGRNARNPGESDAQHSARIVREWRRDARNLLDALNAPPSEGDRDAG